MFLLMLGVILCVCVRVCCFVKVQVFVRFSFEIWGRVVLYVMSNILGEPATSYAIEYVNSRCLWHVVHDTRDKTLPHPNDHTVFWCCVVKLFIVLCFLLCFLSVVVGVVRLKRSLMSQETYRFTANHPFVFVIHERRTDLMLFIGRCMKPTAVVVHHTELWLCICFEFVSILGWGGSCLQHRCWSL